MCGIEESGNKGKRTSDLCGVAPLETGAPSETVNGREVWYPMWKGKIDDEINAQFIKAVADRIWENEKVSICIISRKRVLISLVEYSERSWRKGGDQRRGLHNASDHGLCEDLLEEHPQAVSLAT